MLDEQLQFTEIWKLNQSKKRSYAWRAANVRERPGRRPGAQAKRAELAAPSSPAAVVGPDKSAAPAKSALHPSITHSFTSLVTQINPFKLISHCPSSPPHMQQETTPPSSILGCCLALPLLLLQVGAVEWRVREGYHINCTSLAAPAAAPLSLEKKKQEAGGGRSSLPQGLITHCRSYCYPCLHALPSSNGEDAAARPHHHLPGKPLLVPFHVVLVIERACEQLPFPVSGYGAY
jgi:hypothetical protein